MLAVQCRAFCSVFLSQLDKAQRDCNRLLSGLWSGETIMAVNQSAKYLKSLFLFSEINQSKILVEQSGRQWSQRPVFQRMIIYLVCTSVLVISLAIAVVHRLVRAGQHHAHTRAVGRPVDRGDAGAARLHSGGWGG